MTAVAVDFSASELELLETVRQQQGLATPDQTAEWLFKQRLRQSAMKLTGRSRAINEVGREPV